MDKSALCLLTYLLNYLFTGRNFATLCAAYKPVRVVMSKRVDFAQLFRETTTTINRTISALNIRKNSKIGLEVVYSKKCGVIRCILTILRLFNHVNTTVQLYIVRYDNRYTS